MDQKQEISDRIKKANNILVTVKSSPSVDQLASCIGLTLALNKLGKHATAVFSGQIPSTIEFLQPEKTLEANTDSLRDFIISLDKSKADKLRYKVEDKVVKIFITPYRTSISDKDLEFSQGDFNVDVVIALGVHDQGELDQAITAHGRILHDAAVVTINVNPGGELGSINWLVPGASSLCELTVDLLDVLDKGLVDEQIATALLTGIVAETNRFSNERTTPDTMSISAELMAAGANQQLVATKLAPPPPPAPERPALVEIPKATNPPIDAPPRVETAEVSSDGTLEIAHGDNQSNNEEKPRKQENSDGEDVPVNTDIDSLAVHEEEEDKKTPRIHIDDQGSLHNIKEVSAEDKEDLSTDPTQHVGGSRMIMQPPSMGGAMSATGLPNEEFSDPLSLPQPSDIASGQPNTMQSSFGGSPASANISPPPMPFMPPSMTPGGAAPTPPSIPPPAAPSMTVMPPPMPPAVALPDENPAGTLEPAKPDTTHVDNARDAVMKAISSQPSAGGPEPIQALNAQPLGGILHSQTPQPSNVPPDLNVPVPADNPPLPNPGLNMPAPVGAPPPVPPPMMPTPPQ